MHGFALRYSNRWRPAKGHILTPFQQGVQHLQFPVLSLYFSFQLLVFCFQLSIAPGGLLDWTAELLPTVHHFVFWVLRTIRHGDSPCPLSQGCKDLRCCTLAQVHKLCPHLLKKGLDFLLLRLEKIVHLHEIYTRKTFRAERSAIFGTNYAVWTRGEITVCVLVGKSTRGDGESSKFLDHTVSTRRTSNLLRLCRGLSPDLRDPSAHIRGLGRQTETETSTGLSLWCLRTRTITSNSCWAWT
mmetsp:Transcript_57638/g.153521  ORF Transcript_57638/g.153521 Transcript_57638/m.153521 type:complete len:242 (-) Transcript_57638:538-1263(-)